MVIFFYTIDYIPPAEFANAETSLAISLIFLYHSYLMILLVLKSSWLILNF